MTVFQFGSRQRLGLAEDLNLKINEFADFHPDGGGWVRHRIGLLNKSKRDG